MDKLEQLEKKIYQDIKTYVKSLDRPDNQIYQDNGVLIMSCFAKAMEIMEENFKEIK